MTIFEALHVLQSLPVTMSSFKQFQEAEKVIDDPQSYRVLTKEQGHTLALEVCAFYDMRIKPGGYFSQGDYLPQIVLMNIGKFVSHALQDLYPEIIKRQLYWGGGVTFREADAEIGLRLLALLETDLEAQPQGYMLRSSILEALAWIEDDIALKAFSQWRKTPPRWRSTLGQALEQYSLAAGWELTPEGQRRYLYHQMCYELLPSDAEGTRHSPVAIFSSSKKICPSCSRHMKFLFDLDLRDPRLRFLDAEQERLPVHFCPPCSLNGQFFFTNIDQAEMGNWDAPWEEPGEDEWPALQQPLSLGPQRNPYETIGLYWADGLSRIGGHPGWVFAPQYLSCPLCETTMIFIAQLGLTDIDPGVEGMSYAFYCSTCGKTATLHDCS